MGGNLAGVIVPALTPVDDEDRVDEVAFRRVIRHAIDAGLDGIFVGGSAGEGPLLTLKEWARMMEIAQDENQGAIPLLGGVSDTSTRRVQERIRILADIGYEHFVVTPTFYLTLNTPEEHLRLFGGCREAAGNMSMIPYNIPAATGSIIPVEVLCDLARRGWSSHCKESSADNEYFGRLVSEGAEFGLGVFMGDEASIGAGLLAGACGIVPVCANFEPQTHIRAYRAAQDRNMDELRLMQERAMFLRKNVHGIGANWIAAAKGTMAAIGIGSGKPVSPLQPLSTEQKAHILEFAQQLRR